MPQDTGVPPSGSGHSASPEPVVSALRASVPNAALLELAERCEQATGPDQDTDLAINETAHRYHSHNHIWRGEVPRYTRSLDAALWLVPDKWRVADIAETVVACSDPWAVRLFERRKHDRDSQKVRGDAATLPLALCAAALRARAASAIDARSAETGNTDSARQGESAVAESETPIPGPIAPVQDDER